ncbi:hypothetical protein [Niveispirillum fermenti]|uniref:hypothetical protein n=1 Tax=Niveispirillum fermenti TaxID=1233113 RepID=UPI003A87189C
MSTIATIRAGAAAVALAGLLAACGNSMEQRAASGALIGATGGAVLGGNVGSAALGGLAGAGAGVVTHEMQKDKQKRKP